MKLFHLLSLCWSIPLCPTIPLHPQSLYRELAALISSCCVLLEANGFMRTSSESEIRDEWLSLPVSLHGGLCLCSSDFWNCPIEWSVFLSTFDFSLVSVFSENHKWKSFVFIAGFCVLQLELNENDVLFQHWDMIVKKLLAFTVSTVGTIVS